MKRYFHRTDTNAWYEGTHASEESLPSDPDFIARLEAVCGAPPGSVIAVDRSDDIDPRSAIRFSEPPPPAAVTRERRIALLRRFVRWKADRDALSALVTAGEITAAQAQPEADRLAAEKAALDALKASL